MKKILFALIFIAMTICAKAQSDTFWSVLLLKKGVTLKKKQDMTAFSKTGFYLYRNCVYNISTKNKERINGRLVDIKPDTLFFTRYINPYAAQQAGSKYDTVAFHYKQLDKLHLVADRAMGIYKKYDLSDFEFIFKKGATNYMLLSNWGAIYANSADKYELVPHLTAQGVGSLYEEQGRAYFFYGGGLTKPDRSQMDQTYSVQNVLGLTPTKVEKINGIAFGFYTENIKNDPYNEPDSLVVNGLNLEFNPMAAFPVFWGPWKGPYADSIELYNTQLKPRIENRINGVSIGISTINETRFAGLNVVGGITVIDEIHGVSIAGVSNFAYKLKGVSIAALKNRATEAKGVQIGLINKATDMRGIQIGLWNTNGRRSLPFINWQFSKKKKKRKKRKKAKTKRT